MVALIYPMGLILGSWLFLFLMFSGMGFIVQRIMGQTVNSGRLWLDAFWLGWAVSLLILQLWHFVFPVNDIILMIFVFIALISFWVHRSSLWSIVKRLKHYSLFVVIFGLAVLWLSNRAIDMPTAYDTGFRDIQAVMWLDTYPIVPGLNNLFSSLAFNQSVYLYDALLDFGVWSGRAYHIATSLLVVVFLMGAIWGAVQLFRHRDGEGLRWSWIAMTVMIIYILFGIVPRGGISHFLTDTVVDLVGFLCVIYVLDFIQFYRVDDPPYIILKIATLIITGFTLKQSFIVFGIGLGVMVFIIWVKRGGFSNGFRRFARIIAFVGLYGILTMVPWMARGVMTSGYVAYPQSFGRFDVDWAESPELIRDRQEMLATNTRLRYGDRDEVLGSWGWVIPWLQDIITRLIEFVIPMSLSLLMLILYGVGRLRSGKEKSTLPMGMWVLVPMLIMIVVWFLTAPNIKYIKYILWINASILTILAILAWSSISWEWRIYSVYAVLGVGLVYVIYLSFSLGTFLLPAGANDGFYERPMPPIKVIETQTGDFINTPDSHINQCWNIPLPCTPVPHTRIYERVPGDIRHGFGLLSKNSS